MEMENLYTPTVVQYNRQLYHLQQVWLYNY